MGVQLNIDNVSKSFGDNHVIKGVSVDIKPGEFFTLLGPSGCGKTTLLRMIIGFNEIDDGAILIDDNKINDVAIHKRNMGMVFQNYAVFPHMTVGENVAYGLENLKINKNEINERVDEILEVVKIKELKERLPEQLSGGQQQRVALARAIVTHPRVLLMDEPLSNLDAKLRVEMRLAIKEIQKSINITTVYVTHDQEEALAVSDRIAVMDKGVIQQVAAPEDIYRYPTNKFVANFIGTTNFFEAVVEDDYLVIDNYRFKAKRADLKGRNKATVSVRPQEFKIVDTNEGLQGKVRTSTFLGLTTHYYVVLDNGEEIEIIDNRQYAPIIPDGTVINFKFDENTVNIFDSDSGESVIKERIDDAEKEE